MLLIEQKLKSIELKNENPLRININMQCIYWYSVVTSQLAHDLGSGCECYVKETFGNLFSLKYSIHFILYFIVKCRLTHNYLPKLVDAKLR